MSEGFKSDLKESSGNFHCLESVLEIQKRLVKFIPLCNIAVKWIGVFELQTVNI